MPKPLTQKAVEKRYDAVKRIEIPDGLLPGLYLVVQPSGVKSWAVRCRIHGRSRKFTLGRFPILSLSDAREKARLVLKQAIDNDEPPTTKTRLSETAVADVIEQYLTLHVERNNRPSTAKETRRLLAQNVLPKWGDRRIGEIKRSDVIDLLDSMTKRGANISANRLFAATRHMFGWALARGMLEASPCTGVKTPSQERSRDRVLDDNEVALLLRAAGNIGWPFGDLVQLLLFTGQRRSEVAGMRWSEISEEKGTWAIPKERSKNGLGHDVPLSRGARDLLTGFPRMASKTNLIFTTTGSTSISGFSRAKSRLDKAIQSECTRLEIEYRPWTLHDIRRTVASGLARLGFPLPVVEKVLNHTSGSFSGIVRVYQRHTYDQEKRAALEAWGDHLLSLRQG